MTGAAVLSRFRSFDGAEIAYLDEGAGPLVVLLHGLGSDDPSPEHLARPGAIPTKVLAGDHDDDFVGSPTDLAARIPGATARTVPGDHLTAVVSAEFPVAEFVASTHREDASP